MTTHPQRPLPRRPLGPTPTGRVREAVRAHSLGGFLNSVDSIPKSLPDGGTDLPPEVDAATAAVARMLDALDLAAPGPAATAILSEV